VRYLAPARPGEPEPPGEDLALPLRQEGTTMVGMEHLSNHHRNTLSQLFQHPVGHNIEWRAVLSLLEAVGSVEENRDGKVAITLGGTTEYLDPPAHKDIDVQTVVNLRRMLSGAGYRPDAKDRQQD
jgi:hypothetical protein